MVHTIHIASYDKSLKNIFNESTRLPTLHPFEWYIYHFHDPLAHIHISVQCPCFNDIILPTFHTQNDTNESWTVNSRSVGYLLFGILSRYHISNTNQISNTNAILFDQRNTKHTQHTQVSSFKYIQNCLLFGI